MVFEVRIVGSEAAALIAKIRVGGIPRRHGCWKDRHQPRLGLILDIEHGRDRQWRGTGQLSIGRVASAGGFAVHEHNGLARNRQYAVSGKAAERWTDGKPSNFPRLRNIADIEDHCRWSITEVGFPAVGRDHGRTVEGDVTTRRLVAILLTLHPPASGLFWILGIADVDED